nr:hypothetical protein [uncultured Pseudomonas sp.]
MRRGIRLKEWEPGIKREMIPPANLVEDSDGSLAAEKISITVSMDGFVIDPERPEEYDTRIIIMGDSVVECSFIRQGHRLSDVAEKSFRASGRSVRVENGGRSGATILQLLNALQLKIIPLRPEKIVLMNGVIDSDALQFNTGLWSKGDYFNPIEEEKSGHVAPKRLDIIDYSSRSKFLRLFAETCKLFGIDLVMATLPLRGGDDYLGRYFLKHGPRHVRIEGVNDNTRQFCLSNGVPLIDLDALIGRDPSCFYDYFHLNEHGASRVGELLADHIKLLP